MTAQRVVPVAIAVETLMCVVEGGKHAGSEVPIDGPGRCVHPDFECLPEVAQVHRSQVDLRAADEAFPAECRSGPGLQVGEHRADLRSEEHTSELQSLRHL